MALGTCNTIRIENRFAFGGIPFLSQSILGVIRDIKLGLAVSRFKDNGVKEKRANLAWRFLSMGAWILHF
jgi:hypothetical protein